MRLFFAIPLEDELRQTINNKLSSFYRFFPRGTWVNPENMHITLLFLGEVEKNQIPELRESAIFIANQCQPQSLLINELGAFPNRTIVKTLYYAINHEKWLEDLGYNLRRSMFAFGINDHKSFHPHITLSRFRAPVKINSRFDWSKYDIQHQMNVKHFELIESKLSAKGPFYRTVAKFYISKEEEKNGRER